MKTIRVAADDIGSHFSEALIHGTDTIGEVVLDIQTGTVECEQFVDSDQVGEGRQGVEAGKRFIRIPRMADSLARAAYEQALPTSVFLNGSEMAAFESRLEAGEVAARRWIASLRLPCRVEMFRGLDGGPTEWVYDPTLERWVKP